MRFTVERKALSLALVACAGLAAGRTFLFGQAPYKTPPQVVVDILDQPPLPSALVSPDRGFLLLVEHASMPTVTELSRPMLRLAGRRIDPDTNGPAARRAGVVTGLRLIGISTASERRLDIPEASDLGFPVWSPDSGFIAFTNTTASGIELWVADVSRASMRKLTAPILNAALGAPCGWTTDSKGLLCKRVPGGRGRPPEPAPVPVGPHIQEAHGREAPVRTYQDLLENEHDVLLFDYYAASELIRVDVETGVQTRLGKAALYDGVEVSPDGNYILVEKTVRPYSFLVPDYYFPKLVEIWNRQGERVREFTRLPLAEAVPVDGVRVGPRNYHWRPTEPATLVWVEALDEGNPKVKVEYRDRVLMQTAPFQDPAGEIARTASRFAGLRWGEREGLALLSEFERDRRWSRTWMVRADGPESRPELLWDRSVQDAYGDPGDPVMRPTASAARVILQHGDWIYLSGEGASPQGDLPFLDRLNLKTRQTERLFRCAETTYEQVVAVLDHAGPTVLTSFETKTEPPNYFLRDLSAGSRRALTSFQDPFPQLQGSRKELVTYQREDGIALSGTLYLPPHYQPGERLPVVVWAYPREYNDPGTAGQVRGSPHRFTTLRGPSHLFFLTQGYAVFDGPSMPIVGSGGKDNGNDTYVTQLVMNARAAVNQIVKMGIADPGRIGVGGHSYGAFMTANLLAHSDLFRAGIARSGAYNRTLTPFGFQSERRTFWEAPEVYFRMSPFMHAREIKEPILLIHGEADNNSGTFPIQSERLFHALQGLGGTVRLVLLPHESHGYAARESVLHTVAEMIEWFDRHLKNAAASGK